MGDEQRVAVIIEDDGDIRSLLAAVLEQAGFTAVTAANGIEGVEAVREHEPVVTTLDVSMPGIDGFETAKRIRSFSSTYLLMLTARSDEIDTLQGLDSGADDYVTKPFRPRELRARIEAMLRRPRTNTGVHEPSDAVPAAPATAAATAEAPEPTVGGRAQKLENGWLEHHGLRVHRAMHLARCDGADLALTPSEFDILVELLESGRRVVSKAELAMTLRGERYLGTLLADESDARAIEVHMANLRRKLGESPSKPRWIETVRGVGYRLTPAR
ncbi:response regulator transcription factor [Rathayibacter sp. YIM 133350]|uniref:response regulator transcription factor n=1 Tax=Rathayibacter sp. YIM 133350 TaxID=3131992 RepID=UPI00307F200D